MCLKKVELTGFRYASEQFKGFQRSDETFLNGHAGGVEVVPVVSAVSDGDIGRDPAFIVWLSTITGVLGILLVLNVAYAVRRLRKSTRLKTVSFHQTSSVIFLPPETKLGQGYVFTGVCDSVHRGVGGSA